jgi:hypothetical protein
MVAMAAKSEGATINGRKHLFIKLGDGVCPFPEVL